MSQTAATSDQDLAEQLKAIEIEAGHRVHSAPPPRPSAKSGADDPARPAAESVVPVWARHLVEGIEALKNAYNENALRLNRIEKCLGSTEQWSQVLGECRQALEQRNVVSRVMFEALHTELKGYKDAFMLEAVLKPVVRDLIMLYDDMSEIHRQTLASLSTPDLQTGVTGKGLVLLESVQTIGSNLEHNVHFVLEVLERMEVTLLPPNLGKLDKRTQRAVAVETAETPSQDQVVIRIVKRGFVCRDRIVRPEEVVIQKWKEGCLVALPDASAPPPQPPQ